MEASSPRAAIDTRRIGEYGHYVAPLSQLAQDAGELAGVPLEPYLAEAVTITRDEQGVHPEEAAMLYLLVRGLRPAAMLETGTFKGYSSAEIARALERNQHGHLITVDLAPDTGSMVPADLAHRITFHRATASEDFSRGLAPSQRFEIFFHDSLHTFMNTLGELIGFSGHYAPGAMIVCHDAEMDYLDDFGVGKAVRLFAARLDLPYRILDTTCGLALIKWPDTAAPEALVALREEYAAMQARSRPSLVRRAARRLLHT